MSVIESYPQGLWGPIVLQMVAPTLVRKTGRLLDGPEPDEDVRHQLMCAVLTAAATEKLPFPPR
jgi:hypothetical protein